MKCTFPRTKIKQIAKKHDAKIRLQKKVDILLYLDYIMFLRRLAKQAEQNATDNKENGIEATHIKAVKKSVLKGMRG